MPDKVLKFLLKRGILLGMKNSREYKYILTAEACTAAGDATLLGGKGAGLVTLLKLGCRVPPFFIVPPSSLAAGDSQESGCDAQLADEVMRAAADIGSEFAVRSSRTLEDSRQKSFAGQYATYTYVKPSGLIDAIQKVCASARRPAAAAYASANIDDKATEQADEDNMAVIVQRQIQGEFSGVCMSASPNNSDETLVEYVRGAGESLVSGSATPVSVSLSKPYAPASDTADKLAEQVCVAAQNMERRLGYPLDLEWTYADGTLYFLQLRPLTVAPREDTARLIPQGDWSLYVCRKSPYFVHSVQADASGQSVQTSLFGFCIPIFQGALVCGSEFYTSLNDRLVDDTWDKLSGKKAEFFERFAQDIERCLRSTRAATAALKRKKVTCVQSAKAALTRFYNAYLYSYAPMMMRPDDYLARLCEQAGGLSETALAELCYCDSPTQYAQSQRAFLRLAAQRDEAETARQISRYISLYGWMKEPLGSVTTEYSTDDLLARKDALTPSEWALKLEGAAWARRLAVKNREDGLKLLSENARRFCRVMQRFVHLRTLTAQSSDKLFFYARKYLFPQLERYTLLKTDDQIFATYGELLQCLSVYESGCADDINRQNAHVLELTEKRRQGELFVWNFDELHVRCGADACRALNALLPPTSGDSALTGGIACPGTVEGTVRVVQNASQAESLQKGEILVASMTTPDLVCAMERAAGIITDEGGITCHAAILAREYALPCIVGTKHATALLKTGMRVRLCADTGTVEILPD